MMATPTGDVLLASSGIDRVADIEAV